ncbi:zf-HC2 domain-containing protein [Streptomyces tagetis]|uniref:Zf-HC2 domain-containing protein n=1 Tax=Streptomyces tagetis TaxID=2820809 RepID=A0A941B1S2_9ACTN|nr:zf-HC2 domain-containing protein [Streptomyces sp. RG38]MBQ0828356.1 zf-HC2 domain-containing protein [Streptomyces sp. RG38]
MSGTRPKREGQLAEQHLGDRLSALVDGELGHDARERVLAHVATCPKCKTELDAQRRLKSVFAETAPPGPSESFLARLQGLPGGDPDAGGPPGGGTGFAGLPGRLGPGSGSGVFGTGGEQRFEFDYVPARPHPAALPAPVADRGFRIADVSRHDSDRSASRGLRFAFAAAGAVSLAAIALGGVTVGTPDTTAEARGGSGSGSNVTPLRTQGTAAAATPENQRRRSTTPLLGQSQGHLGFGDAPAAPVAPAVPTSASAPLLPGVPAPSADPRAQAVHALTTPVMAGAAAMSPLIRPLRTVPPLSLSPWPTVPDVRPPGLLAAPAAEAEASSPPPASPGVTARPAP